MWHTKFIKEVEKELSTDIQNGLNSRQVEKRKLEYGTNKLNEKKKENIIIKFFKQFNDFMIIILLIAAVVSAFVSKAEGNNDYFDTLVIILIVVFNAIMGLVQEEKAERSLEALKKMSEPTCKVKRNGQIKTIASEEVVPGDIILLEAGNYVPADSRLIQTSNLKLEESSLTGETIPILKEANVVLKEKISLGDMQNMVFATTMVVNGHGEAIVTEIGMNTKVGKIARMITKNESPQTPIQKKLSQVGKELGIGCVVICFLIFLIGLLRKIEPIEMFMTSVGLAVAAIPEGLPAVVTIMLSIGVTKMARKNSIIRKLPAVETLGSSNVICSDKTGTLTQNKMKVVEIKTATSILENEENYIEEKFTIKIASMCTDTNINGRMEVQGDPTEVAIANKALEIGENKVELYKKAKRIYDIPFDSNRKMMTTIHKVENGYRIITKGAPDVLLKHCTQIRTNCGNIHLDNVYKRKIIKENLQMAKNALRVIAVSYLDVTELPKEISSKNVENNLVFVGLIGMIDTPRKGVKEAVETCKRAGIKTVMITGDHIETAKAIAKELGILKLCDLAITGEELDKIPQKVLEKNIKKYSVFARVTPEHKVRIVKAFRSTGAVVAMTGDGVNDAPALKCADIGIAMGKNGTDVAKSAADMILADDNFVTIVEAVRQGRNIFDNIKKAVHFLISTNIGEIVTIFLGLILGVKSPLLAIQLLWINLVTDSIPAIALGLEPEDKDIMKRKPVNNKKGIFANGLWSKIFVEGVMIGVLTLFAFSLGNKLYGIKVGRTMAFLSLGLLELVHSFNVKSDESIFKVGILNNKYLIAAFVIGVILQVGVVIIPNIAKIFNVVQLTQIQWILTLGISTMPVIIVELQKKVNELKSGKIIYEYKLNMK